MGFNIQNDYSTEKIKTSGILNLYDNDNMECFGQVQIIKNGKTYTLNGNRIVKKAGKWYVDGKEYIFD